MDNIILMGADKQTKVGIPGGRYAKLVAQWEGPEERQDWDGGDGWFQASPNDPTGGDGFYIGTQSKVNHGLMIWDLLP